MSVPLGILDIYPHFCCAYVDLAQKDRNMLIGFTVENDRSIKDQVSLSCVASSISDIPDNGVTIIGHRKLLNTLAIFGPNSSGKSNFLSSLAKMRWIVLHSVKMNATDQLPFDPFLLSINKKDYTSYEVEFTIDAKVYKYGFSFSRFEIIEEHLSLKAPSRSLKMLFKRDGMVVSLDQSGAFSEADSVQISQLNPNRLYLSLVGQLGGKQANEVLNWFDRSVILTSGVNDSRSSEYTKNLILDETKKGEVLSLMKQLQLGVSDLKAEKIKIVESDLDGLPNELKSLVLGTSSVKVKSLHNVYDDSGVRYGETEFDFFSRESQGTQKIFNLSGPILTMLKRGGVLCVDELDAQIHPLLVIELVRIFNDPNQNRRGAQLIFTAQNTSILGAKVMRRDQFRFIEKNETEVSRMYSLMDVSINSGDGNKSHAPRKDSNLEKNYLEGRLGAIPDIIR